MKSRAADDLEHVGCRGLLFQRFAQLVEQAGVLDGDNRLSGEILHQLDLLLGERPDLLAVNGDRADQLVSLSIGTKTSVRIPPSSTPRRPWITLDVGLVCREVGNMDRLLDLCHPANGGFRRGM